VPLILIVNPSEDERTLLDTLLLEGEKARGVQKKDREPLRKKKKRLELE
jgi:hypothetical protein